MLTSFKKNYLAIILVAVGTTVSLSYYFFHKEPVQVSAPPEHPEFKSNFQNALQKSFKEHFARKDISVEVDLLQSSTIQSGIESPKYYIWVLAKDTLGRVVAKGAARVTVVDEAGFAAGYALTHFISDENIRKHPADLGYIFPNPLAKGIIQRAQSEQ